MKTQNTRVQDQKKIIFSAKIQLLLVLEAVICSIILGFNMIQSEKKNYPAEYLSVNNVLFTAFFIVTLIIFFFCFRIMRKHHELQNTSSDKLALEEYMHKLESLYEDMNTFRYEYMSILSIIQHYIEREDTAYLKTYFQNRILPSSQRLTGNDALIGKLSNIKLIELKGVLYSKLILGMNENLEITLEIQQEIQQISMGILDLAKVIGIFMDNAIEGASFSADKKLVVLISYHEDSAAIIISNSVPDTPIDLSAIYEKDISSKTGHSGLGLFNAKNILNKYDNIIHTTTYNHHIFTQSLEICTKS